MTVLCALFQHLQFSLCSSLSYTTTFLHTHTHTHTHMHTLHSCTDCFLMVLTWSLALLSTRHCRSTSILCFKSLSRSLLRSYCWYVLAQTLCKCATHNDVIWSTWLWSAMFTWVFCGWLSVMCSVKYSIESSFILEPKFFMCKKFVWGYLRMSHNLERKQAAASNTMND